MAQDRDSGTGSAARAAFLAVGLVGLYYVIQIPSVWLGGLNPFGAPPSYVENGAWLYMTVHHLVQMVLALCVIAIVAKGRLGDWGLNLRDWRRSLRITREFATIFAVIMAISVALQFLSHATPRPAPPLTVGHVVGTLFFMAVISGVSEEILFRGMMQTWLSRWAKGDVGLFGWRVSRAGFVTAVIFALVHINFTLTPFEVTHLYWPQVGIAFVLGLLYSWAYDRTGSLLAPILMHNLANWMMASVTLAVAAWR